MSKPDEYSKEMVAPTVVAEPRQEEIDTVMGWAVASKLLTC